MTLTLKEFLARIKAVRLARDLRLTDVTAPVAVAIFQDSKGDAVLQVNVADVRLYASGQVVLHVHLPEGAYIAQRKKKYPV